MPRNKTGGSKAKKQASKTIPQQRILEFKTESNQHYALVTKCLGSRRFSVLCDDGKTRVASLFNGLSKKFKINTGDFIMVTFRECLSSDDRCDIVHQYTNNEVKRLHKSGEIDEMVFKELFMVSNNDDDNKPNELNDNDDAVHFSEGESDIEIESVEGDENDENDIEYKSDDSVDIDDL